MTVISIRSLALALGAWTAVAVVALPAAALPSPQKDGAAADARPAESDAPAARGFEFVLPADTQLFLGIADLEQAGKDFAEQPWGQLWDDPACAPLRTEFERRLKELLGSASEKLEVDLEGALEGLQGGIALAWSVHGPEDGGPMTDVEELRLSVLLVAGLAEDHDALERTVGKLLEKLDEENEHATLRTVELGEWDQTEVYGPGDDGPELALRSVFTKDTLIVELAMNESNVTEAVLDELDGRGSAGVLADQPRFRSSIATRSGGVQLWVDAQALCALARPALDKLAVSTEPSEQVTAGVLRRSGLLDIEDIAFSSAVDSSGSRADMNVRWPTGGWLHEVLERLCVPGAFDTLADIQADAQSVTAMRIDFAGLFDVALKELLATGTVEMSQVVDTLSGFEEATGFALRDDLLESFDGQFSFVSCEVDPTEAFPGGNSAQPQNFVLLVGLKDGAAFTTLLEDLVRSRGLHAARKRTEFQGFELFNVPVFPGFAVNYAVLPDLFVASLSPTLTQEVLRRCAAADLPRYSERKDLAALRERLSPGLGMLSVGEAAQSAYGAVVGAIAGMTGAASMQGPNPVTQLFVDLPLPELSVFEKHFKGLVVSAVTVDAAGIRMESVSP